jgi:hypothetical protein
MVCPVSGLADAAGEFAPGSTVMTGGPVVGGKGSTGSLGALDDAGLDAEGRAGVDEEVVGEATSCARTGC